MCSKHIIWFLLCLLLAWLTAAICAQVYRTCLFNVLETDAITAIAIVLRLVKTHCVCSVYVVAVSPLSPLCILCTKAKTPQFAYLGRQRYKIQCVLFCSVERCSSQCAPLVHDVLLFCLVGDIKFACLLHANFSKSRPSFFYPCLT